MRKKIRLRGERERELCSLESDERFFFCRAPLPDCPSAIFKATVSQCESGLAGNGEKGEKERGTRFFPVSIRYFPRLYVCGEKKKFSLSDDYYLYHHLTHLTHSLRSLSQFSVFSSFLPSSLSHGE